MNTARKLRSQLDPWDLLPEANFYAPADHFAAIEDEECVLSFWLSNPGRVTSVKPEHFTGRDRPRIAAALIAGTPYNEIAAMADLDVPSYPAELFLHPSSSTRALRDCVANLKRLAPLRLLRDDVMRWLQAAPTMSLRGAQVALAMVGRRSCEAVRK